MIVRQFLQWMRMAPAAERADATAALARAYLYSELSRDDRAAAEGALIMLLDDPSPLVRVGRAPGRATIRPCFWMRILSTRWQRASPECRPQSPIAPPSPPRSALRSRRSGRRRRALFSWKTRRRKSPSFSLDRIVVRHGHLAAVRESMLARDDLSAATRQALVAKLSHTLAGFVIAREWLEPERAERVVKEACEKATIALAAQSPECEIRPLIRHLRES